MYQSTFYSKYFFDQKLYYMYYGIESTSILTTVKRLFFLRTACYERESKNELYTKFHTCIKVGIKKFEKNLFTFECKPNTQGIGVTSLL